jgi:uncharacterized protein YeaO (DUF488 family)
MVERIRVKRIYEPAVTGDGQRILVDRIWPRGVSRGRAELDEWMPEVAPSAELRQWFGHDPARWDEFRARYRSELVDNPHRDHLADLAAAGPVTLLYSARDTSHNQAVALASFLDEASTAD